MREPHETANDTLRSMANCAAGYFPDAPAPVRPTPGFWWFRRAPGTPWVPVEVASYRGRLVVWRVCDEADYDLAAVIDEGAEFRAMAGPGE